MFWNRRPRNLANDLARDIEEHIAIATDENVARGMSPEEARYAALRKFGNVARVKEDTRAVWIAVWLDTAWADVRHAFRRILRSPGLAATVVFSLALAFVPNVAMFSVFDSIFLNRLPVREPDRIVTFVYRNVRPDARHPYSGVAYNEIRDVERSLSSVQGVAFLRRKGVLAHLNGRRTPLWAVLTNHEYFQVLGIPLAPGVVISHSLWEREFSRRPDILGQTLIFDGHEFPIAGVAPRDFHGIDWVIATDLWIPAEAWLTANPGGRSEFAFRDGVLWARLRPGVTLAQAAADAGRVKDQEWVGTAYNPIDDRTRGGLAATAVGVLLLSILLAVACANVAGVLLARAEERRMETAIRQSLGAPRWRLVREWMIESLILASIAAAFGVAGANLLQHWMPDLPTPLPIHLNFSTGPRVWIYAGAMVLLSTVLFGLMPAWKGTRPSLAGGLRRDTSVTVLHSRISLRSILVVAQVAAAQVLLFVAGLSWNALHGLTSRDPGLDVNRPVALAMIVPSSERGAARQLNSESLAARLAAMPRVRRVAYARTLPLMGIQGASLPLEQPGREAMEVLSQSTGPNFLPLLGVPILAGRDLQATDANAVLINRRLAQLLGGSPLGRQIRLGGRNVEIAGIFQDAAWNEAGAAPAPRVLQLEAPRTSGEVYIAAEVSGDPNAALPQLRAEVAAAEPTAVVVFLRTLRQHYDASLFPQRTGTKMLYGIALLAVILTITGLHGVTTALFLRRSKEFGIRLALGARPAQIVGVLLASGLKLTAAGVAVGLALAVPGGLILASKVQGISVWSVSTIGVSAAAVLGAVILAAAHPARRALRLHAADVLRAE